MVYGLAKVVEEGAAPAHFDVRPELHRDHGAEVGAFHGVAELVLAVAGAKLEPAEVLDQVRVHARHVRIDRGLFPRFGDGGVQLLSRLGHDLFDARWVDATVLDQLGERQPRHFPTDRVEGGKRHGVRGVVDDEIDARSRLQGADVAALPPDDAALRLLRGDGDDGDRAFMHDFR